MATTRLLKLMFHPAEFDIIHKDRNCGKRAFVGIRRDESENLSFVLPPGFDAFPASDAAAVSECFFGIFNALQQYGEVPSRRQSADQDGHVGKPDGLSVAVKDDDPAMLYSKIPMLEAVLEGYDELRIHNILYRDRRTDDIDYSQIHRYLDKAIYLEGDVAYVDEMVLPRPVLTLEVSDLVRMFCFIYAEVKRALAEAVNPEIEAQAGLFKSQHLYPDSAFFGDLEAHQRTAERLKEKLDDIDRETTYKNADYWHFFTAVEKFLYGEMEEDNAGVNWGITSFAPIWEDMCMVWIEANKWNGVMYADTTRFANRNIGGRDLFADDSFDPPPFGFGFGPDIKPDGYKRHMRPDIVRSPLHCTSQVDTQEAFEVVKHRHHPFRVKVNKKYRDNNTDEIFSSLRDKLDKKIADTAENGKWRCDFYDVKMADVKNLLNEAEQEASTQKASWRVIDFKCVPQHKYTSSSSSLDSKARSDKQKQITYEYALQLSGIERTKSCLCIPAYFKEHTEGVSELVDASCLHRDLRSQDIEVKRYDFSKLLTHYIESTPNNR